MRVSLTEANFGIWICRIASYFSPPRFIWVSHLAIEDLFPLEVSSIRWEHKFQIYNSSWTSKVWLSERKCTQNAQTHLEFENRNTYYFGSESIEILFPFFPVQNHMAKSVSMISSMAAATTIVTTVTTTASTTVTTTVTTTVSTTVSATTVSTVSTVMLSHTTSQCGYQHENYNLRNRIKKNTLENMVLSVWADGFLKYRLVDLFQNHKIRMLCLYFNETRFVQECQRRRIHGFDKRNTKSYSPRISF